MGPSYNGTRINAALDGTPDKTGLNITFEPVFLAQCGQEPLEVVMPLNPLPDHKCKLPNCDRLYDQKSILPHDCTGVKKDATTKPIVEQRLHGKDKHYYEYYVLKGRGFGHSGPTKLSRWIYLTEVVYCPKCHTRRMQPELVKIKKTEPSTAYRLRCECKHTKAIDYAKCVSVFDVLLKDDDEVAGKQVAVGAHPWMEPIRPLAYEPWRSADLPFVSPVTFKIQLMHNSLRGNKNPIRCQPVQPPKKQPGHVLVLANHYLRDEQNKRPEATNDVKLVEKLYNDMGFVIHVPTDAEGNWIKDFTAQELHQRIEQFIAAPYHKDCASAWIFLIGHGAANRAGHPVIGWVNPADGETYVEPLFELLEHLKVLGTGLQIEKCARFFMTVACSGGKSEIDWGFRTARPPPPGTAAVIQRLDSATTARSSSVMEVARGCCLSRQRDATDTEASTFAPDTTMLHTSHASTSTAVAGRSGVGVGGAPEPLATHGEEEAGPSGIADGNRFMDAVKSAIEKYGAGELSPEDRRIIDAKLKLDPKYTGLVEIIQTETDEATSSSGTLCGFAAIDGFMGIQAKESLFLVELNNFVRDPEHHPKSFTDLLETVGEKVRRHRYYDVEAQCVVRQTTAYLSRLHGTYRLPPFRTEGPPPSTPKPRNKRKAAEKPAEEPPSKKTHAASSDDDDF